MSYWRLFYHITFGVKHRAPLISEAIEPGLHRAIAAKVVELGGKVHAVGGIEDHVHLAVSISPGVSLADFIGQVKGSSSHFVNHVLRPGFPFAWQREYGVVSFGEKQLPVVIAYIHNQRTHHQEESVYKGLENTGENEHLARGIAEESPIYEILSMDESPV